MFLVIGEDSQISGHFIDENARTDGQVHVDHELEHRTHGLDAEHVQSVAENQVVVQTHRSQQVEEDVHLQVVIVRNAERHRDRNYHSQQVEHKQVHTVVRV